MDSVTTADRPLSLFYSYSHKDEAFCHDLRNHLYFLRWNNLIAEWHDRMIGAGAEWQAQIERNLTTADVILLLVSADFIASDYCWGDEMTTALTRHDRGEARVIPVILRPCRWMSTPIGRLQAVPKDGRPVSEWTTRDAAFDDVAVAVERIIQELREERCRAAEEAQRVAESEAARAGAAAAPSPGAEAAPPSPACGRGSDAAADDQQPLPHAGEVGALAPGEGASDAPPESKKPRSRILAIGAAVVAVGIVGYVATQIRDDPADQPQPVARPEAKPSAAAAKPLDTFRDCDTCPEMVVIPGGTFMMGSPAGEEGRETDEGPQRKVAVEPFAIGKTEVTFDQWDACVAAGGCNGYRPSDAGWGRGARPVINVSWGDAHAFVAWLEKKTGKPYRLPTEAEWEYATRAGTTTPFSFGATISTAQANYAGNYTYGGGLKGEYRQKTVPVGSLPANPWGLHEVHGNVWEWVEDCWHDSYKGAPTDGSAWVSGDCARRVVRGGSWDLIPRDLRSALRFSFKPDYRNGTLGFRVARTLTP